MQFRVLPHQVADGPTQFGVDQAILESVDRDPEAAVVRTYSWSVPTLSLGYFQESRRVHEDDRWRGVPVVRRPSGGGALWHDREITYATAIPRDWLAHAREADPSRAIHRALVGLLRDLGLDARLRGEVEIPGPETPPFLCFLGRDPTDIVVGTDKIVGSAQRRRRRAILQHGALLIERSSKTPELPGVRELGIRDDPPWDRLIPETIAQAFGAAARADGLRPEEVASARDWSARRYSQSSWNQLR